MPKKKHHRPLTLKQSRFADAYIDTDGNATEAYRRSYNVGNQPPQSLWRRAHEVLHNSKVSARIEQLKRDAAARKEITLDEISEGLREAAALARDRGQVGAMATALMGLAKLGGLVTDRQRVEHTGQSYTEALEEVADALKLKKDVTNSALADQAALHADASKEKH